MQLLGPLVVGVPPALAVVLASTSTLHLVTRAKLANGATILSVNLRRTSFGRSGKLDAPEIPPRVRLLQPNSGLHAPDLPCLAVLLLLRIALAAGVRVATALRAHATHAALAATVAEAGERTGVTRLTFAKISSGVSALGPIVVTSIFLSLKWTN